MQRRALFSLINVAVAAAALVVLFAFPRYAGYAVYAFFGWFVVSITFVWFARGTPPVAASSGGGGGPAPGATNGTPLHPGRPLPASPPPIDFCVYCATTLPPGASRCLACGHPVLHLA